MTDDDIKQLRELAQAATKGPWKHLQSGRGYENYVYALDARYDVSWAGESPVKVAYFPHDPYGLRDALDAAYIAAASPDAILALLSRLESAERALDALRRALEAGSGAGDARPPCGLPGTLRCGLRELAINPPRNPPLWTCDNPNCSCMPRAAMGDAPEAKEGGRW